jgi:hypothetical protein
LSKGKSETNVKKRKVENFRFIITRLELADVNFKKAMFDPELNEVLKL